MNPEAIGPPLYETFQAHAEAAAATVRRVDTWTAALDAVIGILREEAVADAPSSRAVWADSVLSDEQRRELKVALPGLSFTVTRESADEAKVGVSLFDWGLADTGSVAQDATSVDLRLVSSLPLVHIALLDTTTILPDLATLLPRLDPRAMRYLSVITGPSRTADIERVLTIGVHGPERLHLVCFDRREG